MSLLNKTFVFFFLIIVIFGCDKTPKNIIPTAPISTKNAILVLNEGNFQMGNASLSLIDAATLEISDKVFQNANSRPLGDVCQSAKLIDGNLWIVLNNSGKIEICDTINFKSIATINGLKSPRYLTVRGNQVFVTDLYDQKISIIDKKTFALVSAVNVAGWTEQISVSGSSLFFINKTENKIGKLDENNNIEILNNIIGVPLDFYYANNMLHAITYFGDSLLDYNISNQTHEIFPDLLVQSPFKLVYDAVLNRYVVLNANVIYQIQNGIISELYKNNSANLYGIKIIKDKIFVADAKDFSKKSEVLIFDRSGVLLKKLPSGNITNDFLDLNP